MGDRYLRSRTEGMFNADRIIMAMRTRPQPMASIIAGTYSSARVLLAPVLRCRLALARLDLCEWMYPTDAPHTTVPGKDLLRILLIGDAAVAGFGIRTHQLGVAAHLARRLAALTGRGVDIRVQANPSMAARSAPDLIEAAAVHKYDAIILMLATNDALALTAVPNWSRSMGRVLALLQTIVPNAGFITMIADISAIGRLASLTRLICGTHAAVLNRTIEQLCAKTGHSPIRLESAQSFVSATYEAWANSISATVFPTIAQTSKGRLPVPFVSTIPVPGRVSSEVAA